MNTDAKNLLYSFSGYGSAMVFGLFSGIAAARLLGPVGRGQLAAIQVVPTFLAALAGLGMPQAIAYFSAREPSNSGEILGSALALALLSSIPVVVIGYFFQIHILGSYPAAIRTAGIMFLAFIPLSLLNGFPWSTLFGLQHYGPWNILRLQPQLVYCLMIMCAYLLGRRNPDWITDAYLLGTAAICVTTTWILYKRIIGQSLSFRLATTKKIFPYAMISVFNFVPNALNQRMDQMLIVSVLDTRELGLYAVAVSWAGLLNPVMSAIGALILPRLATLSGQSAEKTFGTAARWSFVALIIMAAVLLALTPFVIPLVFGEQFRQAIVPGVILVFAGIFSAFNLVLSDGFRGYGKPEIPLYAECVGLGVTVVGLSLYLKDYGIIGAAAVSLVSYLCSTVVHAVSCFRLVPGIFDNLCENYRREWKVLLAVLMDRKSTLTSGVLASNES